MVRYSKKRSHASKRGWHTRKKKQRYETEIFKIANNIQSAMSIIDMTGHFDYILPLLYVALQNIFDENPDMLRFMAREGIVSEENFTGEPLFELEDYPGYRIN